MITGNRFTIKVDSNYNHVTMCCYSSSCFRPISFWCVNIWKSNVNKVILNFWNNNQQFISSSVQTMTKHIQQDYLSYKASYDKTTPICFFYIPLNCLPLIIVVFEKYCLSVSALTASKKTHFLVMFHIIFMFFKMNFKFWWTWSKLNCNRI